MNEADETLETPEIESTPVMVARPTGHKWFQQGEWLKCQACTHEHGSYLGVSKHMIGIDPEGNPILEMVEGCSEDTSLESLTSGDDLSR